MRGPLRGQSRLQSRGAAFPLPGDTGTEPGSVPEGRAARGTRPHGVSGCGTRGSTLQWGAAPALGAFPFTPRVPTRPAAP